MHSSDLNLTAIGQTANTLITSHLRTGRALALRLSTSSMWPSLMPGDRVYIRTVRADACRTGDILVRRTGDAWVVHRLIGRADSGDEIGFVTKGDNALTADAAWPAAQLAGIVVAVEPAPQTRAVARTQSRWRGRCIAWLSRGQLLTNRIEPAICRRVAIKLSRACLRAATRFAL